MEGELFLIIVLTVLSFVAGVFLFTRCKCNNTNTKTGHNEEEQAPPEDNSVESLKVKKAKPNKKPKTPIKAHPNKPDALHSAEPQVASHKQELFVDYVKGVNKHVDCIAIAPHAHLIATTTADAKVNVTLDATSTYFLNFRKDTFSALDFWCREKQQEGSAFFCGAMATDGRMVCFEIKYQEKKITQVQEVHCSSAPLQKGVVTQLVASKAPWVITRSEGDDTELRIHSYQGDLLATVDTKQVQNLQLSVSGDGCFFGCAAWSPGVKIFEVKAKGGSFQKVEKAMDIRSSQGLLAFAIAPDRSRAAFVDKSGNLCLWRIDVRHNVGEDTKLICQTSVQVASSAFTSIHFTLDGSVLLVVTGANLHFFKAATLELYKSVESAALHPIEHLLVAPNNKFCVICTEGSRPVIWRLPLPPS